MYERVCVCAEQVGKQLEHVNKLIQQARRGREQRSRGVMSAAEARRKAQEAVRVLEERYRENHKYSEQIRLFCTAKRAELQLSSGEEGEGLLLTDRGGVCLQFTHTHVHVVDDNVV